MKLYELKEEYEQALSAMEGLDQETIEDSLAAIKDEIDVKAENCARWLKGVESEVNEIDLEIKRLNQMKKTRKNNIEWMRNYLKSNMIACNIKKIESPIISVTLREPLDVIEIDSPDDVPEQFKTIEVKVNKTAIKQAIKAGEVVEGARMVKGDYGIMIK